MLVDIIVTIAATGIFLCGVVEFINKTKDAFPAWFTFGTVGIISTVFLVILLDFLKT